MAAEDLWIRKSEEDGVEILGLRHPPVNALSAAVLESLGRELDHLEQLPGLRCLVVTGDGPYFSAGADLKEMASVETAQARPLVERTQLLFERLSHLPVPVVAAINGLAVGGGLELALACDLRIAGESAKLGAPEAQYGLMPAYGGTQRLPRLVGAAKASELIFTGAMIPAAEALRIGLVNKTVPAGQELRAARDWAHTIGQKAPRAIRAAKRAMREGREQPLAEGLRRETDLFASEVLTSRDLLEGIRAFSEHRPPKFRGE
jgi:enoyl-CoA hydratase/carnithine racemase